MKKLLALVCSLVACVASAAHLQINVADFTTGAVTNRTVQIKPLDAPRAEGTSIVVRDWFITNTAAAGSVIVSNVTAGLYELIIRGVTTNTTVRVMVPTNAGVVSASAYLTGLTGTNSLGANSWSISSSDLRYPSIAGTGVTFTTNAGRITVAASSGADTNTVTGIVSNSVAALNGDSTNIILVVEGDSLSTTNYAGVSNSWADKFLSLRPIRPKLTNAAESGAFLYNIVSQYDAQNKPWRPASSQSAFGLFSLWGGFNDIRSGQTGTDTFTNFLNTAAKARADGFSVVGWTIHQSTGITYVAGAELHRIAFNDLMRAGYASGLFDVLADVDSWTTNSASNEIRSAFDQDGIHFNELGNIIIASNLNRILPTLVVAQIASAFGPASFTGAGNDFGESIITISSANQSVKSLIGYNRIRTSAGSLYLDPATSVGIGYAGNTVDDKLSVAGSFGVRNGGVAFFSGGITNAGALTNHGDIITRSGFMGDSLMISNRGETAPIFIADYTRGAKVFTDLDVVGQIQGEGSGITNTVGAAVLFTNSAYFGTNSNRITPRGGTLTNDGSFLFRNGSDHATLDVVNGIEARLKNATYPGGMFLRLGGLNIFSSETVCDVGVSTYGGNDTWVFNKNWKVGFGETDAYNDAFRAYFTRGGIGEFLFYTNVSLPLGGVSALSATFTNTLTASNVVWSSPRWVDEKFSGLGLGVGGTVPARTVWYGGIYGRAFQNNDLADWSIQFQHGLANTNAAFPNLYVIPHIHVGVTALGAGESNATFIAEIMLGSVTNSFGASILRTNTVTMTATNTHYILSFGAVTNNALAGMDSVIAIGNLTRVAAATGDIAARVHVHSLDVHIPVNEYGSAIDSGDQ